MTSGSGYIGALLVNYLMAEGHIVEICELDSSFSGEVEVDKSYFVARRIKGKRGCGAYGKTIVFGLLKREGKVYTEDCPRCEICHTTDRYKNKINDIRILDYA